MQYSCEHTIHKTNMYNVYILSEYIGVKHVCESLIERKKPDLSEGEGASAHHQTLISPLYRGTNERDLKCMRPQRVE